MKKSDNTNTNPINPNKLPLSKWTAVTPQNREKHFLVTDIVKDENDSIMFCKLEAVLNRKEYLIKWQELKNNARWKPGWH